MKHKIKIAVEFETEVDISNEYFANNIAQTIEKAVATTCKGINPTHDFCFMLDTDKDYRLGNFDAGLY